MMENTDWIALDSTRITHYAYNPDAAAIYVIFTDGVRWQYRGCGPEVWEQFQLAPSKGRFIHDVLDHVDHDPM